MKQINLGKYQHYKGKFYEVIGIARHSETLEEFVVYKALYYSSEYGDNALWIRPKKMFLEYVNVEGKNIPRFKYVGDI
jgi:cyclomaltodextrinase / maltogenic alpha-amylase / neopullulanase